MAHTSSEVLLLVTFVEGILVVVVEGPLMCDCPLLGTASQQEQQHPPFNHRGLKNLLQHALSAMHASS